MKQLSIILLLWVNSLSGDCQISAITNDKMNILYECVDNPLTIVVENTSCSGIVVSSNNGKIIGNEEHNGHYLINNVNKGQAVITIKKKTKNGLKVVGAWNFRVHAIPSTLSLDSKTGGEITKVFLCQQVALRVQMGLEIDGNFPIFGFTVIVHRNTEEIFKRVTSNTTYTRFDSVTQEYFTTLNNNDSIFFTDVTIKACDGTARKTDQSLAFKITEAEKYHKPIHTGEEYEITDPITGERVKKRY